MQSQRAWFQNRMVIALLGAVLVGSIAAIMAVQAVQLPARATSVNQGQSGAPTATANGNGTVTVQGTITSIDLRDTTFRLQEADGSTVTVRVNDVTAFGGVLGSIFDVQTGMSVQVIGTQQGNGTILATSVTAQDN